MSTGRRPKLNPELTARIVQLINAGNYIEVACAACRVSEASYYSWLATGRVLIEQHGNDPADWPDTLTEHERNQMEFLEAVKQATAEAEAYAVGIIRKQMPDQWTAAMTYLERRFPSRWKRRDEHTVQSPFQVQGAQGHGIDEQALLEDPEAAHLIHQALRLAAAGALEGADDLPQKGLPAGDVVDATVVDEAPASPREESTG